MTQRQRQLTKWKWDNPYDPNKDWCGPKMDDYYLLGKMIPDAVLGVDISYCCYTHDAEYSVPGTEEDRKRADDNLAIDIYQKLTESGISSVMATSVAKIYHEGVSSFGHKYFSYLPGQGPKKQPNSWGFLDDDD